MIFTDNDLKWLKKHECSPYGCNHSYWSCQDLKSFFARLEAAENIVEAVACGMNLEHYPAIRDHINDWMKVAGK